MLDSNDNHGRLLDVAATALDSPRKRFPPERPVWPIDGRGDVFDHAVRAYLDVDL